MGTWNRGRCGTFADLDADDVAIWLGGFFTLLRVQRMAHRLDVTGSILRWASLQESGIMDIRSL